MKNLINSLVFLVLVNVANSQVISLGKCPDHEVVKNFDLLKYLGRWYDIQHYQASFAKGGACGGAEYTLNDDGSVRVYNSQKINGELDDILGRAVISFPEQVPLEGKLNVTFEGGPKSFNYWILDTDYTNYSIVWSCGSAGALVHYELAWVLSRVPYIDGDILDKVNANIDRYLKRDKLRKMNQNEDVCFS